MGLRARGAEPVGKHRQIPPGLGCIVEIDRFRKAQRLTFTFTFRDGPLSAT
jgi:hypothetical protein